MSDTRPECGTRRADGRAAPVVAPVAQPADDNLSLRLRRPAPLRLLLLVLQAAVSCALLAWVVTDLAATPGIGGLFRATALPWLAAGIGCIGFSVLCGVYRWRIFLGMQRTQIGYFRALRISLIGMFFDLFFPSSAGGDTIRSLLVMREHPQRKAGGRAECLHGSSERVRGAAGGRRAIHHGQRREPAGASGDGGSVHLALGVSRVLGARAGGLPGHLAGRQARAAASSGQLQEVSA